MKYSNKAIHRVEMVCFLSILLLINLPLFVGSFSAQFVFYPELVGAGEWWRLLSFPFVHVSLYHLLLDACAVLLLWWEMGSLTLTKRWRGLILCWVMSLLVPLLLSRHISINGLTGLSGIGHGLFAWYSVESLRKARVSGDRLLVVVSVLMLVGLVGKSGIETLMGEYLFASLHFGSIGVPIVEAHFGGAVGGILAALLLKD